MSKPTRADLVQRETIIDLLTDEETASVSTAETAIRLAEGDEFVDLEHLDQGVQRADGIRIHMGSMLSRRAVQEQTWSKIVQLLGPLQRAPESAVKPTPKPPKANRPA